MAIIGNNPGSPTTSSTRGLFGTTLALRVQMTEGANGAASIFWYGDTVTGASIHAAIYTDGADPDLVVNETAAYTTVATGQWHEVVLDTTVLSASTYYILCVHDSGAASVMADDNGGGNTDGWQDYYTNLYDSGWQNPATGAWDPGTVTRESTMYLEYTVVSGSAKKHNLLTGIG